MASYEYIVICPVAPVEKQCPVELEVVENHLPVPLDYETFQNEVLPSIIIVLLTCYGWKKLSKMVWNR